MNPEQVSELRARAAVHAALAEPVRLAIIDHLTLGDASPSELQTLLGVPSNLLAHHVNVLEQAGLLSRSRSEGDRRRSYLRLMPDVLDGMGPAGPRTAPRVVFVCTHNSARSQLAVALWRRRSPVPVASAGTHPAKRIHPGAVAAAKRRGLPLRRVRPQDVSNVVHATDLVVTVCDTAHEEVASRIPSMHWSIPDPVRVGTDDAFDRALDDIAGRVALLAPRVSLN
jgi:protein-tyrosine-phosphatase/DNA-binding transcriptional ArsR family regulator